MPSTDHFVKLRPLFQFFCPRTRNSFTVSRHPLCRTNSVYYELFCLINPLLDTFWLFAHNLPSNSTNQTNRVHQSTIPRQTTNLHTKLSSLFDSLSLIPIDLLPKISIKFITHQQETQIYSRSICPRSVRVSTHPYQICQHIKESTFVSIPKVSSNPVFVFCPNRRHFTWRHYYSWKQTSKSNHKQNYKRI